MKCDRSLVMTLAFTCSAFFTSSCGVQIENERSQGKKGITVLPGPGQSDDGSGENPIDPKSLLDLNPRARWTMVVGNQPDDPSLRMLGGGSASNPVSVSVAAAVTFNVDNSNFAAPAAPIDQSESFGSLDVDRLRDNELRNCGASGTDRCTTGYLRVYTQGTPGEGLWNHEEGYGLPISSNSNVIGLDPANAYVFASADISTLRVARLRDFSGGNAPVVLPIDVDFFDAMAGNYSTTLVVEYLAE